MFIAFLDIGPRSILIIVDDYIGIFVTYIINNLYVIVKVL
jgi:hypothetical protein